MPGQFDLSAMRTHLGNYITEISDLLTTPEEVQNYSDFCDALFRIQSITNFYYTPQSDGSLPVMDQRAKLELRESYARALREAEPLLAEEDTGEIGTEMRRITRELVPLLQSDADALDQVDLSQRTMSLPEMIGQGRELVVDLGDHAAPVVSGSSNSRQYIRIGDHNNAETGYFTPTVTVEPTKEYTELLNRLQEKYPAYRPLIDELRNKSLQDISSVITLDEDPFSGLQDRTVQEKRAEMERFWFQDFYNPMGFRGDQIEPLAQRRDYNVFTDELFNGLKPIRTHYHNYTAENSAFLKVKEGANLDRRNLGMYRMACLLHTPDLVAAARPMTVLQNGQRVTGTFMAEAYGVDVNHVQEGDPILGFKPENFENPAVLPDIAAMQALDFICGNVDRHPGNFLMRFDPPEGENARLVGITLIDNDMSFSNAAGTGRKYGTKFIRPDEMGVIGEKFYNSMRLMTREQMEMMLSDCGLSREEIDQAWARKEELQHKIEADLDYFRDKEPGYTEAGRIRLVKDEEWTSYSLKTLGKTHEDSQFVVISNGRKAAADKLTNRKKEEQLKRISRDNRRLLGYPVEEPAPGNPVPAAGRIMNGENPDAPGVGAADPDAVKLLIPSLSSIPSVGNELSKRYILQYQEGNEEKKVFFTTPQQSSGRTGIRNIFSQYIKDNPQYEKELRKIHDYYSEAELENWFLKSKFSSMPAKEMGFSDEESRKLNEDAKFLHVVESLSSSVSAELRRYLMLTGYGVELGEGKRIELRNVTMSDVGEILGTPNLLANSRTVQVMADGEILDGVVMDLAKGEDPGTFNSEKNNPATWITKEQADRCYNQPGALKQLADLQILDYICLNTDRHARNLFYQYEGLGTDDPKFVGIQGIDNDASCGSQVPRPDQPTNKLPALNDMKVISATMWEAIQDGKTLQRIEEKMRLRNHSEAEINAAKQRIQQIKDAVSNKKLRVVADQEWGVGRNSYAALSTEAQDNYFRMLKRDIVDRNAGFAEERKKLPEDQRPPYVKKELSGAKCIRTTGFGKKALEEKSWKELKQQAENEFLDRMKNQVKDTPQPEVRNEQDFLSLVNESSRNIRQALDDANPTLHSTSRTYKKLISANKALEKLTVKLQRKLQNPEDTISVKDSAKLIQALNKVKDCAAAYHVKKTNEINRGQNPSDVGYARMETSDRAKTTVNTLLDSFQDNIVQRITKNNPMDMVQFRMQQAQGGLSGLSGEKLRKKVAEVLYYKSLTKIDLSVKNSKEMKNALLPREIRRQRDNLMEMPAFKKLAKMPEKELRSLAAGKGAEKLLDHFVTEVANDMKAQKEADHLPANNRQNQPVENVAAGI